jgi:hypothetical protein
MSKSPSLTAEEENELIQLEQAIAAEKEKLSPKKLPSESDKFRENLLSQIEKAGIKIAGEAGGAAVGQKAGALAGAPFAPFTAGLSVPIGAAIGGFAGGMGGYEATTRGLGEEPTMRGRLQAGLMGAIPFAPEARLMSGAAGQLAKVTGREIAESGVKMGAANLGAVLAPAAITGEIGSVTPAEMALAAAGGAAGGAAARYAGAATSGSAIPRSGYIGPERAIGPSEEAASAAIAKSQNIGRDRDLLAWQAIGGINDPRIVNPSKTTKALQTIAGESDEVTRSIQNRNTIKAGEIARFEVGLPAESELTLDVLKARAQELKTVYGDIKSVSRAAKEKVDDVEDARDVMRRTWKIWKDAKDSNKGTTPALLERAKNSTAQYQKLENQLDAIVTRAGRPDLSQRLIQTRPKLAKLAVIESAVNPGRRTIDVSVIGNLSKDAPGMLDGNLGLMGRVWNIQEDAFQIAPIIQAASSTIRASNTRRLPAGLAVGGAAGLGLSRLMGLPAGESAGLTVAGGLAGQGVTNAASRMLTGEGGGVPSFIQQGLSRAQYRTNVPSNLSLFLAKSGGPSGGLAGSNVQSFIDRYRQEQQGISPSR